MKKLLFVTALAGLTAFAAPAAHAGDNVVLVELFTSQGCSSCPPADKNLAELTGRDDVLPLSMHVDYWDYLGWRDTFANREYTERQYEYRRQMGARVVYTPQMIVQGVIDVPGYRPDLIEQAVSAAGGLERTTSIQIENIGGMWEAGISGGQNNQQSTIWLAAYDKIRSVEIERGENAGRTIVYHNVVDSLMRVGPWHGGQDQRINLPKPSDGEGVAVWLQDHATGQIIAASFIEE